MSENITTSSNTPSTPPPEMMDFSVSTNAVARIAYLLKDEPEGSKLRVSVEGGGCSGFQYHFEFDTEPAEPEDLLIEKDGAIVVIDTTSLDFIKGSMLDYVETLGASIFEITNPNATASCGCGNSFSVM